MGGRIVVGIDGSDESVHAMRWALDEGRRRDVDGIDAVMVWQSPYAVHLPTVGAPREQMEIELGEELDRALDRAGICEGRAPDDAFPIEPIVLEGKVAPTLLDHAKDADLLVLGARGHGQFAGMLIGSVSQHCVGQAACPVAVIRDEVP
jgi:nucleotide-binding universal stress UspA family protein